MLACKLMPENKVSVEPHLEQRGQPLYLTHPFARRPPGPVTREEVDVREPAAIGWAAGGGQATRCRHSGCIWRLAAKNRSRWPSHLRIKTNQLLSLAHLC